MPLKPTVTLLSEAVAAADAIRTSATALAAATTVSVDQLGRELNTLQARFEVVAPLLVLWKRRRIQQLMLVWTPPAQTAVGGGRSSVTPVALAWVRLL